MRLRTVLVLLILVVGLAAFIELYEHKLPSSEERIELDKRVLELESSEVLAVDLEWESNLVRLRRHQEDGTQSPWRLVEPFDAPADNDRVSALLDSLIDLEKKRTLTDSSRSEVGLDPPRLIATLSTSESVVQLEVGSEIPASDSMIVAVEGQQAFHVVNSFLWADLSRRPGDWRRRSIFPGVPQKVARVVLDDGENRLELVRKGDDLWLDSPIIDRADSAKTESLLSTLATMEALAFIDGTSEARLRDMGLEPPEFEVVVDFGAEAEPFRLSWGRPVSDNSDRHFAAVGGQAFETGAGLQNYLGIPAGEWRSLALTSLRTFQIDSIEIEQDGHETLELIRAGADWKRNGEAISFPTVSDFLYAITGLRAAHLREVQGGQELVADDRASGLTVKLKSSDREELVTVQAWEEGEVLARVDDREIGMVIDRDEFTEMLEILAAVRSAGSNSRLVDEQQPDGEAEISSDQ